MTHLLHPSRVEHLARIAETRRNMMNREIKKSLAVSGGNSRQKHLAVRQWYEAKERGGQTSEHYSALQARSKAFEHLSSETLHNMSPRVYDVSALISKLPSHSVKDFRLGDYVLPLRPTIYLSFGQREELAINREQGLYFEGAYVRETYAREGDETITTFQVTLVSNDPDFEKDMFGRPLGETLRRTVEAVGFDVRHDKSVLDGSKTITKNASASHALVADIKTCMHAYDIAIKSMLFLQYQRDIEVGLAHDADGRGGTLLPNDSMLISELYQNGCPLIRFVGRNTTPIARMYEPEWYAEELRLGIW